MGTEAASGSRSPALVYVVTAGLGLAFAVVLMINAWRNVIEDARRDFEVESAAFRSTVAANARAGDEVLTSLVTFVRVAGVDDDGAIDRYIATLLENHRFIRAVVLYAPERDWAPICLTADTPEVAAAVQALPLDADSAGSGNLRVAVGSEQVIPGPSLRSGPLSGHYYLARAVVPDGGRQTRVAAIFIDANALVGAGAGGDLIGLRLLADSQGLGGRQTLLESHYAPADAGLADGELTRFAIEGQTQFPGYSIRLNTSKAVHWGDIDPGPLLIAFVIGGGTMLLMVALAHARESQARELRQRNALIEQQVVLQTRQLAEARDQALEASRVKSEFLASMSHEIRTPLNAIIGMAELLSETRLDNEQSRYVGVFRKAGEALLSLVNDILDLSKIEARQLELERIPFRIREVLDNACEIHALKCQEKGIALNCQVDPAVPPVLVGDPSRLRQIILNLVGNAIKFTEQGSITVNAAPDPEGAPGSLRFSVVDTGIGIPADKVETIFSSFTQVDSSTTRKYGGTGLGLTISQKLVSMMDGRIWVESEPGVGSTFLFTANFGIGEDIVEEAAPAPQADLAGLRVLLVDDNDTNRLVVEQTLAARGVSVESVDSGRRALERFHAAVAAGTPHDVVIADGRMPQMDGRELVARLREGGADPRTVLMFSSSNLVEEVRAASELGVGAFLVKPVKRRDLLDALQRVAADAVPATPVPVSANRRLLLVEDTADNRLLIRAYLKKTDFVIDEAENGAEALEKFRQGEYALVLMDVQMPVMDGHAATRAIREWEQAEGRAPTPVIALTAHAIREEMDKSMAAGCTAHLTKPIKKSVLIETLSGYLGST